MTIYVVADPQPIIDSPTFLEVPEGGEIVGGYVYPGYFTVAPDDYVNTAQIDFVSFAVIDVDVGRAIIESVGPSVIAGGLEILAWVLYRTTVYDIVLPQEICIPPVCIPFTDICTPEYCWVPPWAGETITSMYQYRLGILAREQVGSAMVRPQIQFTVGVILAIAAAIIAVGVLIIGFLEMRSGRIRFGEMLGGIKEIVEAPGNIAAKPILAASLPLAALGVALVAGAIILPVAMTKVTVGTAKGPVQATLEAGRRR